MDEDKTGLKIILGVLGVLAIVAALWRVLAYEPAHAVRPVAAIPANSTTSASHQSSPQERQHQALLDEFLAPTPTQGGAAPSPTEKTAAAQPGTFVPYPQNRASYKQVYPGRTSGMGTKRFVDTNFYTPDNKQPSSYNAAGQGASRSPSWVGPHVNFMPSAQSRMQEERARMLAPYLRPNRQDQQRMDEKWAKLAAGIERAVAQALMPKSKKEAMIEKYSAAKGGAGAAQGGESSGFTGALAPVGQQLAAQKQSIVQSMDRAFGSSAAQQASSLMDSYAGEVAQALNTPGITPEQATKQVRAISKKYQDKMDKMAEKNQYDKFVADRVAKDNQQKEELGALYPEQKAQISALIDQTREKDLALATQNLPRDEYFTQLAQNNQTLRNGIAELVTKGGKSVQDFHQWEQKKNKEYLDTLGKLEEQGKIQSVARTANADEKQDTQAQLEVQSPEISREIEKLFGAEAKNDFESISKNYEQTLQQINNAELSIAERANQKDQATKQANRQIIDLEIRYVEKMNIPDEQKQVLLEKLRQDYNNIK